MIRTALAASAILLLKTAAAFAAPPASPAALKVAPLGTTAQILTWTDGSTDETGLAVERLDGSTWILAATVTANTTLHILRGQPPGIQTYRVSATNADGSSAPSPQASTLRMNVLFFLADDMGYKDIVANRNPATDGPTIYETPALDTLVSQGVSFTNAYCSGPKCVVARRALQTGMYDFRDIAIAAGGGVPPERVTLGEAMKAGGYRTCFIGKWHLGGKLVGSTGGGEDDTTTGGLVPYQPPVYDDSVNPESQKIPAAQGYDVSIAAGEWGAPPLGTSAGTNPQIGGYFPTVIPPAQLPTPESPNYWYGLPGLYTNDPAAYLTDRLTTEATGFIGDHLASHASEPFFLTLAHYAVHTPLQADPARVAYFEAKKAAMAADFAAHPAGSLYQADFTSDVRNFQDQPVYAAMMDSFDDSLAAIRAYLAATDDPRNPGMKLADTTILILSSDHGGKSTHWVNSNDSTDIPTSNYPLRQGKTWCYEGGLKIPLIVYWPGFTGANVTADALANGADIYKTILDMSGVASTSPDPLDSISFAESTINPAVKARVENPHWFTNADTGTGNPALGAFRFGDYKLVYHMIRRVPELYNLTEDTGEQNDISSIRPDLVAEYLARLIDRRDGVGAKQPLPTSNSWIKDVEVVAPVMTVPAAVPNGVPSGLTGTAVSDTVIDLTWTDGSTDEDRFVIQRKLLGSGAFIEFATVPASTTRFRDTGLTPGTTYQYRIQAENLRGWAGPSNQITVATPASSAPLPVIARGDSITTLINETRIFQPLANDQGNNLTISAITQGTKGTATISGGGTTITYVPATGVTGVDTLTYTATASDGGTATGTIELEILANHNFTPPPELVYPTDPARTDVDVWEFNDANGTTVAAAAKTSGPAVFTGATPTVQAGSLKFSVGTATASIFRNAAFTSIPFGQPTSGSYEMSFRITSADLSGGANNTASPAYVGIGLRGKDAANATSDPLQIRLQENSGNLALQVRAASTSTPRTFTGLTLATPLAVRVVMDFANKSATVYSKLDTEAEQNHGNFPMTAATVLVDNYRLASLNNTTDWGASDHINVDYLRFKSLTYPTPPSDFQMWIDSAEGSVTPSPDKAPDADPDGDGVKNILEYSFGGHPYDASSFICQFPTQADTTADPDTSNELILTLPVIPGIQFSQVGGILTGTTHGVTCQVLGSLDLADFSLPVEEVYPSLESGLPPVPRGWEYRSFRMPDSNGAPRAFMRVSAESKP